MLPSLDSCAVALRKPLASLATLSRAVAKSLSVGSMPAAISFCQPCPVAPNLTRDLSN